MSQKQDSSWSWLFWQSGRKRYLVFYCTMCDYVRWWDWRREAMAGLISVMCCCLFVFWDNQQLKVLSGVNTEPLKRHTNQNIIEWQGLVVQLLSCLNSPTGRWPIPSQPLLSIPETPAFANPPSFIFLANPPLYWTFHCKGEWRPLQINCCSLRDIKNTGQGIQAYP